MTEPPAAQVEVASINLKLPPFWTTCPEAWFLTVESQFANRHINADTTKFNFVVAALPAEVSMTVLDVLRNPPKNDKYKHIKDKLIQRHSLSEEKRLEELLQNAEQGDRSPSTFYREMELLATSTTGVNSALLQKLWLRKLPPAIKISITASGKTDVDEMLNLADKIWDVSTPQVQSVATTSSIFPSEFVEAFSKLTLSIDTLKQEVSEIKRRADERVVPQAHNERVCSRCRNRSSSRNYRRHSRSPSSSGSNNPLCWYHERFGNRSKTCIPPCNFNANLNPNGHLNN